MALDPTACEAENVTLQHSGSQIHPSLCFKSQAETSLGKKPSVFTEVEEVVYARKKQRGLAT
jgi:hypothetical protein